MAFSAPVFGSIYLGDNSQPSGFPAFNTCWAPPGVLAVSAGEGGGDPSKGGLRSLSKYQTDRGVQIDGEECGWVQVTEKATHDAFGEIVLL